MKAVLSALILVSTSAFAGTTPSGKSMKAPLPEPECPVLSYNYGEIGYIHQNINGPTANGSYLEISHLLIGNLFADASLTLTTGDFDFTGAGAGLGYYIPLIQKFHLLARTGWAYADVDGLGSTNEFYVSPGLRTAISCNLEFYAKAYYFVPEEGDNNWAGGAGLIYYVLPNAGINVGGAVGEDDNWSIQAGLRYNF
jgi:hypothetical protein